ncbi:LolA family protein [Geobacter argillaceus]|uniref:Outer membrane lipoprotein carrier protein n=1 Tax=Geobacter argillaceus TaxID=345631 RepID=A0A562VM10_9BACT|nr:outer membrane lipoprotein carrier protein LolA [Geobacter argillaceus]TWJ18996.1 outer membrane lipoprotein carrier protein [Geobacter argillaceus]
MIKHTLSLLCGILLLLAALPLRAAAITPLEGLEAMRRSFARISDFSAEITQEKQLSLLRKKLVMHGRVRFRKPDLFLMELDPPYASRLLMRDSIIEQAVERSGKPNRIPLPPEQGLRRWFDNLSRPLTAVPEGMQVRAELNNGVYTLAIVPPGAGQVRELVLAFLEDGTLRRLVIEERSGDRSSITFKRLKRNQGLSERDFRLE